MPDAGFSILDDSGLQRVKQNGSARFDFREGAIAKPDVGLPDSAYAPDLVAPDGTKFQLQLEGVTGVREAETDRIRFNTTDTIPTMDIVYYFLTAGSFEDLSRLLSEGVEKYGIDADAVERWIDTVETNPGIKDSYALAPGNALGFDVVYDRRYDGSKDAQVAIVPVSATEKIGA